MRSSAKILVALLMLAVSMVFGDRAIAGDLRIRVIRDASGIPIPCVGDPKCHNRFHPEIPPVASANPGA